jgi:hypothetical protein
MKMTVFWVVAAIFKLAVVRTWNLTSYQNISRRRHVTILNFHKNIPL